MAYRQRLMGIEAGYQRHRRRRANYAAHRGSDCDFATLKKSTWMKVTRMRNLIVVALTLLLCGISLPCHAAPQQQPEGNWTGGFWIDGNWVWVNVRFDH